jgi:MFS transporter, DHA2 family, multidrug resistance protein
LIYSTLNAQAHLWAFVDTFRMFGLMVLCCLPLILLFKRVKRPVVRQVEVP